MIPLSMGEVMGKEMALIYSQPRPLISLFSSEMADPGGPT